MVPDALRLRKWVGRLLPIAAAMLRYSCACTAPVMAHCDIRILLVGKPRYVIMSCQEEGAVEEAKEYNRTYTTCHDPPRCTPFEFA